MWEAKYWQPEKLHLALDILYKSGNTIQKYSVWLDNVINISVLGFLNGENFVFLNAWPHFDNAFDGLFVMSNFREQQETFSFAARPNSP